MPLDFAWTDVLDIALVALLFYAIIVSMKRANAGLPARKRLFRQGCDSDGLEPPYMAALARSSSRTVWLWSKTETVPEELETTTAVASVTVVTASAEA